MYNLYKFCGPCILSSQTEEKWPLIKKKNCYHFIFDSLNILGSPDFIDRRGGDLLEVILPLPWKYVLVLRNATANLKIDNRSNFDRIFCSKGSREAK